MAKMPETKQEAIVRRLAQIEQALVDCGVATRNLRVERLRLWQEYHDLISSEIIPGGEREKTPTAGE